MHYRNGRKAKNGDWCNGNIAPTRGSVQVACDCLHLDDLTALIAEKGLDTRPPGK